MTLRVTAVIGLVVFLLPPALAAGEIDLTQHYLLLATRKTSTMQKELDQAAAAGYRIIAGSRTSGTEMALLLESVATPPDTYEYFLLATTQTPTMQKELNEVAARGFRLVPSTMMQKERMFGSMEIVVIMEKPPGSPQHYEYLLLATTRTSTLQKEITEATEGGYEVVGMVSRGEHIVIMERPAQSPAGEQ
jgi:hypothetical protein